MDPKQALAEFGLEDKEIGVYLFLLKNGLSSAYEVSKKTGILRQSVYELLSKLENQSLVTEITKNKKSHFEAQPAKKLKAILQEKQEAISSALPNLEALEALSKVSSEVKVFKGLKGLRTMLEDPLIDKKPIRTIQPIIAEEFMKEFRIENFLIKRIKSKIPIRIIREDTKTPFQARISTNKSEFRQVRTSKLIKGISTHYIFYGNKVILNVYREQDPIAILIEDPMISQSFNILFDSLWKGGKKA